MSLWRKGGRGNALELVSLLTFFLADIVKLGEKLEIGKCLPRVRRGSCKDVYVYVDIAGFKGLIKERKSCGVMMILVIVKVFYFRYSHDSRRVLFTYLHQDNNINLLIQFHSFLPILNLVHLKEKERKSQLEILSIRLRERKMERGHRCDASYRIPGKVYFSEGISRVNREVGQPGVCDANEPAKLCSLRPRR